MAEFGARVLEKAKSLGYDIVEFSRQGDVGTVVINQDSVLRNQQRPSTSLFPENSLGAKMLPQGTGAASNPFVPQQKTSKVFTNTFQKTESLTDEQKAQMKPESYQYDVIGHAQNEAISQQRVDVDFEGEKADLT